MKCFDTLILGSGISGLVCAIELAEAGQTVAVLSKEDSLYESNTQYAQGGIVGRGENDSPELLAKDILRAGDKLNNTKAVERLVTKGPEYLKDFLIDRIQVPFYQSENNVY
ncbi:MAG: FAD-dependent oxidoreductase, partial [Spirochaetia bacterium]